MKLISVEYKNYYNKPFSFIICFEIIKSVN